MSKLPTFAAVAHSNCWAGRPSVAWAEMTSRHNEGTESRGTGMSAVSQILREKTYMVRNSATVDDNRKISSVRRTKCENDLACQQHEHTPRFSVRVAGFWDAHAFFFSHQGIGCCGCIIAFCNWCSFVNFATTDAAASLVCGPSQNAPFFSLTA